MDEKNEFKRKHHAKSFPISFTKKTFQNERIYVNLSIGTYLQLVFGHFHHIFLQLLENLYRSIVGSVVECSPATRAARVRFPDDANILLYTYGFARLYC